MNDISFENIGLSCAPKAKEPVGLAEKKEIPDSDNKSRIWKKVICVGGEPALTMVVAIDESIVKAMAIDEKCWLEQIRMRDGIFLRVSHEAPEKEP
jgi:hypothetical protein